MILSGQKRKKLQQALISAFPTQESLKMMLSYELEKNLDAIVRKDNLSITIFYLIETADAEGWIEDLIHGACISNPNPNLKVVAEELLLNHPQETPPVPLHKISPEQCTVKNLRFFEQPYLFKPTPTVFEKIKIFTDQVIGTVNYKDSKQFNRIKVWKDYFIGKIGEEAVYAAFQRFTDNVTKPDYNIYHGKNKSWDADLKVNEIELSVKAQSKSSADKYGLSWTFQCGKYRRDIILDDLSAWVCFVKCNDTDDYYECVVYPPLQIKEIVFGEPKLARLRGEKKVVYAEDNGLELYFKA
ncbi:hypothetical protein NIES4071_105430 (plasmid) [Calothrix sp. NIES-4071]|nr:hypothetical protein NIES4071_105430 [Calothrix sp. NIES-4071]BAZ64961.1 hypothetical protein NIES4105_106940 [Calothrix sp. NIES-4105]